jgi:small subunit ribosomal protein S6
MPQYESIFILPPDSNPKSVKTVEEKLEKVIKHTKGSIKTTEDWGIKKLAYPIKKQPRGHFVYVNYTAGSESQSELTRVFNIDDNVLRFASVKLEDDYDYAKAKATFMPEPTYEDRGRGRFHGGGRDGGGYGGGRDGGGFGGGGFGGGGGREKRDFGRDFDDEAPSEDFEQ